MTCTKTLGVAAVAWIGNKKNLPGVMQGRFRTLAVVVLSQSHLRKQISQKCGFATGEFHEREAFGNYRHKFKFVHMFTLCPVFKCSTWSSSATVADFGHLLAHVVLVRAEVLRLR